MALQTACVPHGEALGPAGAASIARSAALSQPLARLGATPKMAPRQPPAKASLETRLASAPEPGPFRARSSAETRRGVPARLSFAQLGIRHVEHLPEQLEWILAFLSAWPKTAAQAVLLFIYGGGAATTVECVCVRWRAAARQALPPSAPIPDVGPDGRMCFSAPPGVPCGWYWLRAMVLVQHLDKFAVAATCDNWKMAVARNDFIRYEGGWRAEPPQRAWDAFTAAWDELEVIEILEEQYWWGLMWTRRARCCWACQVALKPAKFRCLSMGTTGRRPPSKDWWSCSWTCHAIIGLCCRV